MNCYRTEVLAAGDKLFHYMFHVHVALSLCSFVVDIKVDFTRKPVVQLKIFLRSHVLSFSAN